MIKAKHDEVTLTISELQNIFEAGSYFGREHTLLENEDSDMQEVLDSVDFKKFMNLHHAIELI